MALLLYTLSKFVIAFLPRSNRLLILWLQSPSPVILESKKRKSVTVSIFSPSICHAVIGLDAMVLAFFMFSLNSALSLSSFPLIKKLFSSSSLSAIRMVSSTYLRLLMFLLPISNPHCNSPSPAFLSIKVEQARWQQAALLSSFLDLKPISCSIQGSNCCFLTLLQVSQETGKMVWYSHLSRSFPQFVMIYTFPDFSVVDETQVFFLRFPCFFCDPENVGNLISSSSSFL